MESIKNYGWHFESNTITFVNETIGLTPMQAQLFGALQRGVCATYGAQKGYCYPVFLTEELEKIITSTDFASEGNYVENLVSHIRKKFREVYSVLIHTPEADQIYFPWISTIIKQGFQLKLLPRAELIAEVQSFDMRAVPKRSSEPDYVATNFKYTDATTGVGLNLAEQYIFYQSYKIVLLPEEVVVMRLLFDKRGTLLTQNYILDALCQELGTDVIHKSTMSIWNTQLKRNLHSFALQMQRAGATKFLSIHSVHGRNGGLALTTTDDLSSLEAFMSPPPPQESPCNRKKIETHNKIISPLAIIKTFSILNPCQKQQRQNPQ
jgi:DNA-binding response OmpR family regulator